MKRRHKHRFGIAVKAAREKAGLSAKEVANLIGGSDALVHNWEEGYARPSKVTWGKVVDLFPELASVDTSGLQEKTMLGVRFTRTKARMMKTEVAHASKAKDLNALAAEVTTLETKLVDAKRRLEAACQGYLGTNT